MKSKKKINRALVTSLVTSVSLLGASAAIVFGISSGMFKVKYMNLTDADVRVASAIANNYYSQAIKSQWNMLSNPAECEEYAAWRPASNIIYSDDWYRLHGEGTKMFNESSSSAPNVELGAEKKKGEQLDPEIEANRKHYVSMVLDGSSHAALDHSFNQSLFQGFLNFIKNQDNSKIEKDNDINVYKPGQDTNPFFQEIYRTAASNSRIVGLPGFIHVSPMETIGQFNKKTGLYEFGNQLLDQTGFVLIDGDIPNNQNIASVLFRSDQPAFLAAISTCMYFMHNLPVYHANYKPLAVATYGGAAIPTVVIYMGGFQRGVEFFNEFVLKGIIRDLRKALDGEIAWDDENIYARLFENSQYKNQLQDWIDGILDEPKIKDKLIDPNNSSGFIYDEYETKVIKLGDYSTHFTGTFTAGDAIGITKQLVNRGASAIMPVAGAQTIDTAQEVQNQKSSCIVVGVDAVMEDGDDQRKLMNEDYYDKTVALDGSTSLQSKNHLKFSACKDMTSVVDNISRLAMNNLHWDVDGKPWEHDYVSDYSEEKAVTLDATTATFDLNTPDLKAKVTGVTADLTGKESIIVPATVLIDGKEYSINGVAGNAFGQKTKDIKSYKFESQIDFTFDKDAFVTLEETFSQMEHLDFSSCNPDIKINFADGAFNIQVEELKQSGVYSFNPALDDTAKASMVDAVKQSFANHQAYTNWFSAHHPNPYKSICNIGFKTCGNIQNGMISVSFDGMYYLFEALNHIDEKPEIGFQSIWRLCGNSYISQHSDIDPTGDFRSNVVDNAFKKMSQEWYDAGNTGLLTFKRYKEDGTPTCVYSNYTHIINILGMAFQEWELDFAPYMTIKAGSAAAPEVATETQTMSINDWLDLNMYFTC